MNPHRKSFVSVEPLEDRKLLSAVIKVVGNATRIAPGDTSPARADFTDFGPNALTGPITQITRSFSVKNTGDTTMTFTGSRVKLEGANAADFTIAKKPASTIGAGGSSSMRILFDPTTAGVKNATVVVTSVSNKSVYKFNITATALETTAAAGATTRVAKTTTGSGLAAANGMVLKMNYTGFRTDGFVFDSSLNPGRDPFTFGLGGNVIVGWNKGFVGTKAGDHVVLFIPASEGYGSTGSGTDIPPNTPLIFETTTIGIIGPSIKAQGANSTDIADGDSTPSTTDGTSFGSTARNTTIVKTFTLLADVSEAGAQAALTDQTTPVHVTGANASEFTVSAITNGVFTVTFRPTGTGTRTATIEIPNNNPNDNLYTWVIQGTGT